mmetsp:Transcript_9457/g.9788  ORF Transcript_9457/g.9788 Transcript_9457/m.9788 type:complete len:144 (-) Transcript_9457:72-503(-)
MKTTIEKELRYDDQLGYKGDIELWIDFSGFDSEYHKYFNDQDAKFKEGCGLLGESGERNRIECMILERTERNEQLINTMSSLVTDFVRNHMKENDGINNVVRRLEIETKLLQDNEKIESPPIPKEKIESFLSFGITSIKYIKQ